MIGSIIADVIIFFFFLLGEGVFNMADLCGFFSYPEIT